MSDRKPKVALVSIGIGRVQRGFERYFTGLADCVRPDVDLTLFRSGRDPGSGERVPAFLGPATRMLESAPIVWRTRDPRYSRACLAFALTMLPDLRRGGFDVVHVIDPPLAVILSKLKRWFGFPGKLLLTDGCLIPPRYYPPVDHIHYVAPAHHADALAYGVPASRTTVIPCGIHTEKFARSADRAELRRKYGVAESTFVALCVSAIKRTQKRVDFVIDEVSRLPGVGMSDDVLLWLDGNPEDKALAESAAVKMGGRCRITHVPSNQVVELYGLADVLVHGALEESFGLAICESLCAGLPVLAHDTPHFRWLTGSPDYLVDMTVSGALAERLDKVRAGRGELAARARERAPEFRPRFDWRSLGPDYVELYRKLARGAA